MNPRHELLREAASNLPAFHDEEKKSILSTIEIEADLVEALEALSDEKKPTAEDYVFARAAIAKAKVDVA
ncbi:MAG: hypothetical protein M3O03_12230 [Pseudomonadota bacterium]|nr:hypothetical protein [Pseudomonadota bacterium]